MKAEPEVTGSVAQPAEVTEPGVARDPAWRQVLGRVGVQNVSLLIALLALSLGIASRNPNFFLVANLRVIGTAIVISGILAVAQTVVVILGALDISVGSVAGLASVTSAMVFTSMHSAAWGIAAALGVGLLTGLVNGVIIVFGRVNPVIATLATLAAYKGLAQLVSDGRAQGFTNADPVFVFLARGSVAGVATLIWVFVVLALVVHVMLRFTDVGRKIYAIGGNETAARLAGVNINKYVLGVYALTGVFAAVAGILITARTGSGQPVSGSEGLELESITAAVLGGCALRGGKGTVAGTVLAVLLLGVLTNGMTLLDVNPFWQNVAKGSLLVVAVIIQQLRSGERRIGVPS